MLQALGSDTLLAGNSIRITVGRFNTEEEIDFVERTGVLQKLGRLLGRLHGLRLPAIAAAAGLPVVVSSALDTSIGLAMGAHLAAALPTLDFDCEIVSDSAALG